MPARIPLAHDGQVPLHFTGNYTAKTPRLSAGDTGLGKALANVGQLAEDLSGHLVKVNDERQMLEAEELMRGALNQQSQFQTENEDESTWQANWEKVGGDLRKKIDGMKVSSSTRSLIDRSLGQVIGGQDLQITGQARAHGMMRLERAYQSRLDEAAAAGNVEEVDLTGRMIQGGQLPKEKAGAMLHDAYGKAVTVRNQNTWSQADSLVQLGKFDEARMLVQTMNVTDEERKLRNTQLERGIQTAERKMGNEDRGRFYGGMLKEIASGVAPQQEKIDVWLKAHPADQAHAQQLRSVLQKPAATMESVERFINDKILVYSPSEDKESVGWAELQKEAVLLGLNPEQADRVGRIMAVTRESNTTPQGRQDNLLRKMGREAILKTFMHSDDGMKMASMVIDPYRKETSERVFGLLEERFNVWFDQRLKNSPNRLTAAEVRSEVNEMTQHLITPSSWRNIRGY